MSNFDSQIREGIAEKIAKIIAAKAAKSAIKKAKKLAPDDETMKAEFDNLAQTYNRLERMLDSFCKRNPDDESCKRRGHKFKWK